MSNDIEIDTNVDGKIDSVMDIVDILNQDDKNDENKDNKKDNEKEEEKNEDDENNDDEEIDIDEDEEKEEIKVNEEEDELAYSSVPKRKEILAVYPDFFKKFPAVEKAIYREQQYAEIFATIKEAKEVQNQLNNYRNLEGQLVDGNIEELFKNLKNNVPDAFDKISDNILEVLEKTDREAYSNTLHKLSKALIINAFNVGTSDGTEEGEQLAIAAKLLHKWLYKTDKISEYKKVEKSDVDKKLSNKENEVKAKYINDRLSESTREVSERAGNILKSTIEKYIDPKGVMSDFTKENAMKIAYGKVEEHLLSDKRFRAHVDRLWENAIKENFSEASKLKVRNALIDKAKPILGAIIKDVRERALKGATKITRKSKSDEIDEYEEPKKRSINSDKRPQITSSKQVKSPSDIPRGMSTREFLDME